jgi:5'-nucleotidase
MRQRLLAAAAFLALCASGAVADYQLTILHTNDFHSRFGPIDQFDRDCTAGENVAGKCFGGAARLATAIAEARTRAGADNVLLLDAGDQFPSPGDRAPARPELLAELMNRMGYDAMAVGSREFDKGPEVTLRFLERLDIPALIANADLSALPEVDARITASTILERGGERLGLIGLTPAEASPWRGIEGVKVTDPIDAVRREVEKLTAAGIDKIILISHSGYRTDQRIARNTAGVDVIVGGHTHSYLTNTLTPGQGPYPTMENGVAIVHAFPWGSTLGELRVTFDTTGRLIEAVGDQILLDASVAEDAGIGSLISVEDTPPE